MPAYRAATHFLAFLCLGLAASPVGAQSASGGPLRAPTPFALSTPDPAKADSVSLFAASSDPPGVVPRPTRTMVRDPRQESCSSERSARILEGVVVGAVFGGTIGVLHGLAGHPGLPHTGLDVPDVMEYSPLSALAGAIIGGQVQAGPPCA
jgi:hypothetical protein